jgi:hypothetical protein
MAETEMLASGTVSLEVWDERWRYLVCGSNLGCRLIGDLPSGIQDRQAAHIAACVADCGLGPGPIFDESAVVRLLTGVVTKRFTESEVEASLACPFFRLNVTVHDLHYTVALTRLMQPQRWLVQSPLEWLGPTVLPLPTVINGLTAQPATFPDGAEKFEQISAPDERTIRRFTSFVQDPELIARPYIALERA